MRGVCSINRKKLISLLLVLPIALAALLYGGGFIAQFLYNYDVWQEAGGQFGTAPPLPGAKIFFPSLLQNSQPPRPKGNFGVGFFL